jgi:hypothetical protein
MIKFNQFNVVNSANGAKAKVHYSFQSYGGDHVTIYDKDYGRDLAKVFADVEAEYRNDTDTMTDYFDKGSVVLKPDHPLYAAALERCKLNEKKWEAKAAARKAKWAAALAA